MNLRTLMQVGPAKANELFARLAETSDGAVKTREKLFAELKGELELHTSLEEQHLFPVLRRNAETKELVADAVRDNRELRAKLAELEALPKNDPAFPEQLKELQKTFRQHARDDKRELLPAVQRALSEEQVQGVAEKMEAGLAEAEQAQQDEAEERRAKARQEREEAEFLARQAELRVEQAATAERAQKAVEALPREAAQQVADAALQAGGGCCRGSASGHPPCGGQRQGKRQHGPAPSGPGFGTDLRRHVPVALDGRHAGPAAGRRLWRHPRGRPAWRR